jgi:hypothetical protein
MKAGQVVLEFQPGATPIAGLLCQAHAAPRRFSGWVELLSALELAIEALHLSSHPAEESAEQQSMESKEQT